MEREAAVPGKDAVPAEGLEGEPEWLAPREIRMFVCEFVRSHHGLEILQLMTSPPVRWWSVNDLARRLHFGDSAVEDALETLFEAGLLVRAKDRAEFGYRPVTGQLHDLTKRSLAAYREHPSAVVRLLSSRAVTRVRLSLSRLTERLLDERIASACEAPGAGQPARAPVRGS